MQERAEHTNKAAAAKAERAFVRSRSRRRVFLSAIALFSVVLTLLSIRMMAGLDPSTGNTVAATSTSTKTATSSATEEEYESDDDEYDDEYEYGDDESSSGSSTSSQQNTSSQQSTVPSTRAS